MSRAHYSPSLLLTSIVLIVLLLLVIVYIFFLDYTKPEVTLTPETSAVSKTLELILTAKDQEAGVAIVYVEASRNGVKPVKLVEKIFSPPQIAAIKRFTLADLPWKDGEVILNITVRDASWNNFLHGNKTVIQRELTLDTTPPTLTVINGTLNIKQGGAAAATFTANEELTTAGIRVGNLIFPAFKQEKGNYLCLFTFPWNLAAWKFQPILFGRDPAGNERDIRLNVHAFSDNFRHDVITLSDAFLDRKMPEFEDQVPGTMSNLDRYLVVNSRVREANDKKLYEISRKTASKPLWIGSFKRFIGKPMANFADTRIYYYNGRNIDTQTHLGMDIASTERAEVQAANHGNVVFADNLGIYGLTVIIDHGLGLQTIYSHLSEMLVREGDQVQKGQAIGHTGVTGLASGDHLHFQVMVSGVAAKPIEWWDPHWIKDNLADRIPDIQTKTSDESLPASQNKAQHKKRRDNNI